MSAYSDDNEKIVEESPQRPVPRVHTSSNIGRVATALPERLTGVKLPKTQTQTSTRIPIEYRTLSIHVYDSKRFEGPGGVDKAKAKKNTWRWGGNKTIAQDGAALDDNVDFFGQLDIHSVTPHLVCQRFNVSPDIGLDSPAAAKRLQRNGPNVFAKRKSQYWKKILRYVFGDFCSILWVGVIIFFISWRPLGNPPAPYNLALAIVVLLVIFSQAIFNALQDWSANRVMQSILSLLPENAVVVRDGEPKTVPSSDLVVGDIVVLTTGQKVPADMRILKASNDLRFDRSVLTGMWPCRLCRS